MHTLQKMSVEGKWSTPLGPLMEILTIQKSIFAIGNICIFFNSLIECHPDKETKDTIKSELLRMGIEVIYNVKILITLRIS